MSTREFDLGDVLSITTGKLVSPRHIDGVYDILGHMTGESLMTHQLPRAAEACREPLLAQHPDLCDIDVPPLSSRADLDAFLTLIKAEHGETRAVVPIDNWTHINPIEEACDIVGAEKVWVVDADSTSVPPDRKGSQ